MYAENPKEFNKTYRICIAHTKLAIVTIIQMGVFCGDKTGFARPTHIYDYVQGCRNRGCYSTPTFA